MCNEKINRGRFVRHALLLFLFFLTDVQHKYLSVKHVQHHTAKEAWFTPLQSSTKAAACWLGANKASCESWVFWFLTEKQKLQERAPRSLSCQRSLQKTEKDLRFQSHMQPQLQCLLTAVGVQNLAAPSIVVNWIQCAGCTQADVRGEQLGLLSVELPEWDARNK